MTTGIIPVPAVIEDGTLPHQMRTVVNREQDLLAVSCNCLRRSDGSYTPLVEPGHTFPPDEANAAYSAHLKELSGP